MRNPCTAPWDVQLLKTLSHVGIIQRFGALGPSYMHDGVGALFGNARSGKKERGCIRNQSEQAIRTASDALG